MPKRLKKTKLSCDCCWNHKVCGLSGTIIVYVHQQKKVFVCKTLMKTKGKFDGNYIWNSNSTETEGLEFSIKLKIQFLIKMLLLHKIIITKRISFCCTTKLMNVGESLDPEHVTREFKHKANTFFDSFAR